MDRLHRQELIRFVEAQDLWQPRQSDKGGRLAVKTLLLTFCIVFAAANANATPGAVDKKGCHGHPKHCHAASHISRMKTGLRFVPLGDD